MRRSLCSQSNKQVNDLSKQFKAKDNLKFVQQVLETMESEFHVGNRGHMLIGLVGSTDHFSVMVRRAQSVLRWDRMPSRWSHAFLIAAPWDGTSKLEKLPILEVPLFPRGTNGMYSPGENGLVRTSTLKTYADEELDANFALLTVLPHAESGQSVRALSDEEVQKVAGRAAMPNFDRQRFDLWESLCAWQRYVWSEAEGRNPFREGIPLPAASFIEMAYEALPVDLVPGASERNSAPEHLWNSARYWYQEDAETLVQQAAPFVMTGAYTIRDPGAVIHS